MISIAFSSNAYIAHEEDRWVLRKWQWVVVNIVTWWPRLLLVFQMWYYKLSKLTHRIGPQTQLEVWQVDINPSLFKSLPIEFSWQAKQYIFAVLVSEQISPPDLCYELVLRDCDILSLIQDITLVLCIDGTRLTRPGEQEVETLLDVLLKCLCIRKWEIKTGEIVQCLRLDSPEPT